MKSTRLIIATRMYSSRRVYIVTRMGSFNSAPKINNPDSQDDSIEVPHGLSTTGLMQYCRMMRGENRPPLLNRQFLKPVENKEAVLSSDITAGLRVLKLNAVSKVCSAPITSSNQLRLLQWNILSQCLGQNNDGFVKCPEEALTWENRKYLIVEEIVRNNPDVVCLQEVDHFKFLERMLGSQNYNGIFFPKPDSPCLYIQDNNGPDGCAIFYKRDKFELINFDTRVLEVWRVQSNQVAIVANLRINESGKEICICTTHLKARNGALLSKLRNEQGKDLLRFVNAMAQGRPVIISGDFNAEPIEPIYSTVLSYKALGLSSAYADLNIKEKTNASKQCNGNATANENSESDGGSKEDLSLAELSANSEPPYTTWKIREEGEVCHTIDYIFYSKKHLKVNNCLQFPSENEIGVNRTPSFQYPSDHFSLMCDLEFTDNSNDLIS